MILLGTIGFTGYLFVRVPKGFFPQQDTGRLNGQIIADQDASFQSVDRILRQAVDTIGADPAVSTIAGFTGGGGITNNARLFVALKPLDQRDTSADGLIARLRPSSRPYRAPRFIFSPFRMCAWAADRTRPSINLL